MGVRSLLSALVSTVLWIGLVVVVVLLASTAFPYTFFPAHSTKYVIHDTDHDGLSNALEAKIGTNPTVRDTDGDGIPDGAEYYHEINGVPLPGSDPRHKDLYAMVRRNPDTPPLTASERHSLDDAFAVMPVSNPDGERGITLHLESSPNGTTFPRTESFAVDGPNSTAEMTRLDRQTVPPGARCTVHSVAMVNVTGARVAGGYVTGEGQSPGYATAVNGSEKWERTGSGTVTIRVHTIVHELLHNVVGKVPPRARGVGPYHTDDGWLSHQTRDLRSQEHLNPAVAENLSANGFASRCPYGTVSLVFPHERSGAAGG